MFRNVIISLSLYSKMAPKLAFKYTDDTLHERRVHFVFDINDWYRKWAFHDPIFLNCQSERLFIVEYGDDFVYDDLSKGAFTTQLTRKEEVTVTTLRDLFTTHEYSELLQANVNGLLEFCASKGCVDVIAFLLAQGADVSHSVDRPLQIASAFGHVDAVQFLVERGAHVQQYHYRVLDAACNYGHVEVVKYLVDHGATVHSTRAVTLASKGGHLDVVKFLVDRGADIHTGNPHALLWASENGHLDVVKFLVERGVDIHAKKLDLFTAFEPPLSALELASRNGHLDVVKFLVERGAGDVHPYRELALVKACEGGHLDIVKFLVEQGADIHFQGDRAVVTSIDNEHSKVVAFLVDRGVNVRAGKEAQSLRREMFMNHLREKAFVTFC